MGSLVRSIRSGFSALEMLIAVGLMATAASLMVPMFREYQINADLNTATEHLVQAVRSAETLSRSGKFDATWGVYFSDGTLFAGDSYAERDTDHDVSFPLASTIDTSGLDETTFTRIDGLPVTIGSVYVTSSVTNNYRRIDIDKNGVVTVSGILTFAPGENPDGTTDGTSSTGTTGSTGTDSSSQTSGAPSSTGDTSGSSGSAGSSGTGDASSSGTTGSSGTTSSTGDVNPDDDGDDDGDDDEDNDDSEEDTEINNQSCDTDFLVKDKARLIAVGTNDVTVKVLGSSITYGAGGPKVDVRIAASVNGTQWNDLFGGRAIATGDSQTLENLPSGTAMQFRVSGRYSWLFNKTFQSDAKDGHTYVLQDGDTPPSYPAFGNQQSLQSFLKNILDAQGKISIGKKSVVLIVELGSLDSSADFQDAVLLLTFKEKPNSCVSKAKQRVKVHFDRIENTGDGDAARVIYVGPNAVAYAQNQRIPLVDGNGNIIIDGGLVETAKGLAMERGNGWIRIVSHGSHANSSGKEVIDARVKFKRSYITSVETDPDNPASNPFDGIVNDTASGDEFTVNGSNKHMLFQSRVTTDDDGVVIRWAGGKPSNAPATSSASSSVASSSASTTTITMDACGVPFTIDNRGLITLKGKADVTMKVIGSDATYGDRGPKINVRSGISFNGGVSWKSLFADRALKGGELAVFRDTLSGSQIALSFNGRYSWVFNKTVKSNDGSAHVRVLRSGETSDALQDIRTRGAMHAYLKKVVANNATVSVGNRDIAVLVELGDARRPSYHDVVAILSIDKPQSLGSCLAGSSSSADANQTSSASSSVDADADTDNDSIKNNDDLCPTGTTMPESVPTEYMTFDRYALTSARSGNSTPIFRTGPRKKVGSYTLKDTRGCSCSQILDVISDENAYRFGEYPVLQRKLRNIFPFSLTDAQKFGCSSTLLKMIADDRE